MSLKIKKKLGFSLVLVGCLSLSLASARASVDESRQDACRRTIQNIASAFGSERAGDVVAAEFPGRDSLLSSVGNAKLRVVEVSDIQFVSSDRCKANVSFVMQLPDAPESGGSEVTLSDEWTVRVPEKYLDRQPQSSDTPNWLLGSHVGQVMLRVHLFLPPGTRDELLATEDAIEDGLKPSAVDENAVLLPDQPAAGWYARLGVQTTMISENGEFSLDVDEGEEREIEIINPAQGQVYGTFPIDMLKPAGEGEPRPMIVELAHQGECGMGHEHETDPQWCEMLPASTAN